MKDNVVNFEVEYFVKKEQECQKLLLESKFEEVLEALKEPIAKIDDMSNVEMYCPQNVFEDAILLNLLGKEVHQNMMAPVNYYDFYLMAGSASYNLGKYDESREFYQKAVKLDPASSIARKFEMKIDMEYKELDDFLSKLQDAMYFAYSRSDIGDVFRLAGDYISYMKDYELAIVAYHLSMIYLPNDDIADVIQKCADEGAIDLDSQEWLSEDYMKKFYNTYKIPLMPNEKLIELAEAVAKDAYGHKAYSSSYVMYQIAYDLSYDEKYTPIIKELKSLMKIKK